VAINSLTPILEQTQNLYNTIDFQSALDEAYYMLIKTYKQDNSSDDGSKSESSSKRRKA